MVANIVLFHDHAYILPETLDENPYFEWMFWDQAKKPFDQQCLDYIASIDVHADAAKLAALHGISEASIRTMIATTILLKHCARIGKNLFEIASFVCREFGSKHSQLELLVTAAQNTWPFASDQTLTSFAESFSAVVKNSFV